MSVRILTGAEVTALLTMRGCIDAMTALFEGLGRGEGIQPLRTILRMPFGAMGFMPAALGGDRPLGAKVLTVFPRNQGTPFDSHQGVVLIAEPVHGSLTGILDASSITAIRTAAVSAVATAALAPPAAGDLAILGTGVQARTHLEAMRAVRPIRRVRVWSPQAKDREAWVAWARATHGVDAEPCFTAEAATRNADLICTVTAARTPVLTSAMVADGAHINAVGASLPDARELSTDLVRRARLFTDRRESAEHEAGDYRVPLQEGAIAPDHLLGELGDLLVGRLPGRTAPEEVTVFKSLGLGAEDVAAAEWVLREAERRGIGTLIDLGGRHGPA